MWTYRAKLIRVIDADTYRLELDLGFGCKYEDDFRLLGVDYAERYTKEGKRLTRKAKWHLSRAKSITVVTTKTQKESFSRYLATVYKDGKNIKEIIK